VRADYTYINSTQNENGKQENELRRPRHSGRIVVDFDPLPDRLMFELGAAYVGDHYDDNFATVPATRLNLDAYTLVHFTTRYRFNDRFELTGRVENATNEHYQDVWGYATPGRRGFVGLNMRL
jgi:vitamin B12 transporter